MDVLLGIPNAVAGERVIASLPSISPYVRPGTSDGVEDALRKRLNWFAQRTLTSVALTDQQRSRIGDLDLLGRAVASGVIDGFEVALETPSSGDASATALILMPGHAAAPDGTDVHLSYPLRVPYRQLPVFSPQVDDLLRAVINAQPGASYDKLSALAKLVTIERLASPEINQLAVLPHAMVLVAMPRSVVIDTGDSADTPCPNATSDSAYADLSWEDGFLLAWVPWPQDASLPPWTSDGGATVDARFRNRLAYTIFNNERVRATATGLRSMRAWNERNSLSEAEKAALTEGELAAMARTWPWETLGVPLALVGFDAQQQPVFADRNAVVRQGGGRHDRSALVPQAGEDVLWQARVAQLVEHLAELPAVQRDAAHIAGQFDWLPPAGVLPTVAVDLVAQRQFIFPASFDLAVQPIALDMADALIAEAAPLLPFNLSLPDQVQVLVPVPARFYDPNLLELNPPINPLFDRELSRLEKSREDLLSTRDALRRRFDVLSKAVGGDFPQYPQDDPDALPDETGAFDAEFFARVHVSSAAAGTQEQHGFSNAASRLQLQSADALIVFVRIDAAPVSISLGVQADGAIVAPLIWGAATPSGSAQFNLGDLPPTGVWTRLVVPLSQINQSTLKLLGLTFTVVAGGAAAQVTWGYVGKLSNGYETYWLADAIPAGAAEQGLWQWQSQGQSVFALDDVRYGLPLTGTPPEGSTVQPPDIRQVAELDNLVSAYKLSASGLVREMGVAWPAVDAAGNPLDANGVVVSANSGTTQRIDPSDQPPLVEQGLNAFIDRMQARAAATDDHVEVGFLRARTDIYRVRQNVLGTDKAGQLLTSPSASELIDRSVSVAATEQSFDDYFTRAQAATVPAPAPTSVAPAVPAITPLSIAARAALAPARSASAASSLLAINLPVSIGTTIRPPTIFTPAPAPISTVLTGVDQSTLNTGLFGTVGTIGTSGTLASTGTLAGTGVLLGSSSVIGSIGLTRPVLEIPSISNNPTVDDVTGSSLFSTSFNTVTVGQRLATSAAVETKNAAAAGKAGFVTNSFSLLANSGISLDGINVYGYKSQDDTTASDPAKAIPALQAANLLAAGKLRDFDAEDPLADAQHESAYFIRGLESIDSMVRFLRGVELRAADYRRLQSDATAARGRILQVMQSLQSMIDSLAQQLAETRHDLSVARSLLAEEEARIAALIAKRVDILQNQVPYLLFRRPRLTNVLIDAQLLEAQPADVGNPVPRCEQDHPDTPPELQAMVDTLRDVPARWFRRTLPILTAVDRFDSMQRVLDVARQRLAVQPPARTISLIEGSDTRTGIALASAFDRNTQRIAVNQVDQVRQLAGFSATSLKQAIDPIRGIATLGDLIIGLPPVRIGPTLSSAGLLDDISGVAACLYQAFGAVPPATRLIWAERFSEVDPSFSLQSLTVLPGFGDESLGVDFIAWRGMQSMVDWLFASIEDVPDADAAINDLVRVCLLLSAHAPVKRILDARVVQPVRPQVGGPLVLSVDPRVARIGMQVLAYGPGTQGVIARAVINDIGADGATANFTQVMTAGISLDATTRVQLQSGPALSTPAQQASDVKLATTMQSTSAPRTTTGIGAQATSRLGKQIDVLAGFKRVTAL